jgi:hypothetical protein
VSGLLHCKFKLAFAAMLKDKTSTPEFLECSGKIREIGTEHYLQYVRSKEHIYFIFVYFCPYFGRSEDYQLNNIHNFPFSVIGQFCQVPQQVRNRDPNPYLALFFSGFHDANKKQAFYSTFL